MNHADLKDYAPQARRDFIQAVKDRAAFYGVTAEKVEPVTVKGDVAIIAGHAFPASVVSKRKKLVDRIERCGFNQTMEALAYTWFNRFVAIRFMEIHGYLEHGYRVLSHPDRAKTIPEILELAEHVDLPGLHKEKVIDLKLDGNKESELYQMLLLAQCHALHSAMPFLFEGIDDETELVLPENLLHSDSIIRKLVAAGDPEEWLEVEVLGWLYQFYISERKDEVMARKSAVPTEDIPAVTQLFTPHWIVRYLVENSLGRLWLLNRPGSHLREHMPYYIEGEAETDFLKINRPEDIRLLDPACGSGHMLTYAFDLLFLIYEEEGYVPNEIPALILKHNLHGLEICPRAAQLAEMALVFKSRAKSPRFFQPVSLIPPRILALQNLRFEEDELRDYVAALDLGDLFNEPMLRLLHQFEEATTFGSLIQPCLDEAGIAYARGAIESKDLGGQLFLHETHAKVLRALVQADVLSRVYQAVVANPPYMGSSQMNARLKEFIEARWKPGKADTYSAFILRNSTLALCGGHVAMITIPNWMFLSTFETLRNVLLENSHFSSLVHCGRGVWGSDFGSCAFVIRSIPNSDGPGRFKRLFKRQGEVQSNEELEANFFNSTDFPEYSASNADFEKISGCPIAYWVTPTVRRLFSSAAKLEDVASICVGLQTGDNDRFLRTWSEISNWKIGFGFQGRNEAMESGKKWFPYNKGGDFRKWYGNGEYVVNWQNDGQEIKGFVNSNGRQLSRPQNTQFYFREAITWSFVSASAFGVRYSPPGCIFDVAGSSAFPATENVKLVTAYLCSTLGFRFMQILNPTVNFQVGDVAKLPWDTEKLSSSRTEISRIAEQAISIARADWDDSETSWNFSTFPLLQPGMVGPTLEATWQKWKAHCDGAVDRMQELETQNNRLLIDAYGLKEEFTPEVPKEQITLARADARGDMAAFLSYAVGCMMGRYSLDKPGLILAAAGDSLSEYLAKVGQPIEQLKFAPDSDAIIPILDSEWFEDDIVARTGDFLRASLGQATSAANLRFIEESLGKDLRKYFLLDYYKEHLQTYKKRPIYWLFSSGKQRAFQCLAYVHRYHEGTLSRMRTEYVIPLQGKIASRIDQLADDIQKATSTSHRKKMEKERDGLLRHRTELQAFDEKLRHYADQRIQLDLDDGVKVNYGKFGDLLAEVKAITGGEQRMTDIKQINDALDRAFNEEKQRIIFWNDPECEFKNVLPYLLLENVTVLRLDEKGALEVKIRIERDDPTGRYLLYSPTEEPDYERDWLLDVRLYSRSFRADRASILLDELGLTNHSLRQNIADRRKFFDNRERLQKLKIMMRPSDTAADLDCKMIAVVAKADQPELFNIISTLFHSFTEATEEIDLDAATAIWSQIEKFELDRPFWEMVKATFWYADETPSLKKFLIRLLVTDYANHLKTNLPRALEHLVLPPAGGRNAVVCLAQWRDSSSKGSSYDKLSAEVAALIKLEDHLGGQEIDDQIDVMTFLAVEKGIASGLRERVQSTAEMINTDDVRTIATRRQAGHWASPNAVGAPEVPRKALHAVYDALVAAADFFSLRNKYKDGFDFEDPATMFRGYEHEIYRFDQLYRHFCEAADTTETQGWNILKPLRDSIEASYTNWFVPNLALVWGKFVEPQGPTHLLTNWEIDETPKQPEFFKLHVRPRLEEAGNRRVYVIISDAFRYEAAQELAEELNGKYRFEATLGAQLGVLPSYTALGMASLLPHNVLMYKSNADVMVDDKPTSLTEQRDEILKAVAGMACKSTDLLALKKEQGRDFVKDRRVVYVYHNTIDAVGESTDEKTFGAVRTAIDELAALVTYIINNLNGNHVLITADHGFLFTESSPGEAERSKLDQKPDGTVKAKKRYLIGYHLPDHEAAWHGKTQVTAGAEGEMEFWIPKAANLFHFGGGARFVHGGAMLQEIVVPVITVKHVRGKSAEETKVKPVTVHVLGSSHKITTGRHRFELIQMEPVSDRVKAVTLKIAVYEGEDPVTNIESMTFESVSDKMEERKKWASLVLQDRAYDKKIQYRLVLRDAETGIEQQSVPVIIDRAFDDF